MAWVWPSHFMLAPHHDSDCHKVREEFQARGLPSQALRGAFAFSVASSSTRRSGGVMPSAFGGLNIGDDELGATGAVCYDFQKGKCTRGDKCKFEHTIVDTVKADSGKSPQKDKGDKGGKGSAPRSVFGDEYAPGAVQAARVGLVTCECEAALGAHAEAVV